MNLIKMRLLIKEDVVMGIVLFVFFVLGIILIIIIQKDNKIDLNYFLFGNILGVIVGDLREILIIGVIILLVVVLLYKELLFYIFDFFGV